MFVGFASRLQTCNRVSHFAVGVEAGFEVINVKFHVELFEIDILFAPQIGNGEFADVFQIGNIAVGADRGAIRCGQGLARKKIGGDVGYILALICCLRPSGVAVAADGVERGAGKYALQIWRK